MSAAASRPDRSDNAATQTPPAPVRPLVPTDAPVLEKSYGRGGGGGEGGTGDGDRGDGRGGRGEHRSGPPIPAEKFGMWLLLCSLVMLFAGFMAAYTVLRFGAPSWPPAGMPPLPSTLWVSTAIILASSVTMQWAFWSVRHGRGLGLRVGLVLTTLLGLAFLASQVQIWQGLQAEGIAMSTHTYAAIFYTLTGLHAAHVVGGVLYLLAVTGRALLGRYTAERYLGVELCGMYWHFVDVIWVGLFVVLYLS